MSAHAIPTPNRRTSALLAAAGVAGAALFTVVVTGVVPTPDVAGMLTDLADALGTWSYALVAGLAFLETGAFVGLLVPGEMAIVLGGVVAAQGDVSLPAILALAWVAAALGDLASFTIGRRLGRPFLNRHGARVGVTAPRLERVERFTERHGGKAILVGRFVGLVRAVAPFLAGSSGMRLRAFLPWSLLGTAIWAGTFTLVGYAFHESFESASKSLTQGLLGAALLAGAVLGWRMRRRGAAPAPAAVPLGAC
jgi:membrane-associated protein